MINERIEEIKAEVAEIFRSNKMEDGLIHATYKKYLEGISKNSPYVDSRVGFKGVRV